jgi:hypothetical protein
MELDLRIKAGDIIEWDRQIRMPIEVNGIHICNYICDFRYLDKDGLHYVDVKGMKKGPAYQMFKLKKKLVLAIYKIEIREV